MIKPFFAGFALNVKECFVEVYALKQDADECEKSCREKFPGYPVLVIDMSKDCKHRMQEMMRWLKTGGVPLEAIEPVASECFRRLPNT